MVGGSGRGERGHLLSVFLFAPLLEERRERVEREVAAPDQPLIVLFDHEAGRQPDQGGVVGEDADDVGAAADLAVQALEGVGAPELAPVVDGEAVEGEQVVLASLQHRCDLRQWRLEPRDRITDELARLLARLDVEDRPDQRGQHRLLLAAGVPERLAQEMDGAALPWTAEHLRDRILQAFVRVGDDELYAGEAALDQRAEEVPPERLRLALPAVKADHLASTRLVDAMRDHQTLAHDTAAIADLLHLRVQPQVRVTALQRPRPERFDLLVEASADAGDLRARDPQPQRLDQLIDLPRRHAADVRLLDHRHQRLLGSPARLQERGEVAAAADLRDRELDLAGARVPAPGPVAVAMRQPLLAALPTLGTDQLRHLRLHQLLHDPKQRLAQEVDALLFEQVADDLLSRHPLRLGHRGDSSRRRRGRPDESERHGGRTTPGSVRCAPTPRYGTRPTNERQALPLLPRGTECQTRGVRPNAVRFVAASRTPKELV